MIRVAANLTMLFTEAPMLDRPRLAADAGFDGVEVLFPYDHTPEAWARALDGLPLALINTPAGDWAAGDRGWAAVPGAEACFRADFARAATFARHLGAARLHVMAGNAAGLEADQTFRANLRWAAAQTPDLSLTIEPLNPRDMPGYYLNDFDRAARLIAELSLPNLGLQFDLWHAVRLHGDASAVWSRVALLVTHVQIAGLPARAEPCAVAVALARQIAGDGYAGWIAAEYSPAARTADGLDWLASLRATG